MATKEGSISVKVDFTPKARLWGTDCAVWHVPSATEASIVHTVAITMNAIDSGTMAITCSCKGYQFNGLCKHVTMVLKGWTKENGQNTAN